MKIDFKIPDNVLEALNKIDTKTRQYIFIAALVLIAILYFLIFLRPQMSSLGKVSKEMGTLSTDLKAAKDNIAKVDFYKNEVEKLKVRISELNKKVKYKEETPLVLARISKLADESKIRIDQIMPDNQSQELILENSGRKYFDLPVTIEANGTYHNFGKFLNKIEKDDIFLKIGAFSLISNPNSQQHSIKLELRAVIFEELAPGNK